MDKDDSLRLSMLMNSGKVKPKAATYEHVGQKTKVRHVMQRVETEILQARLTDADLEQFLQFFQTSVGHLLGQFQKRKAD